MNIKKILIPVDFSHITKQLIETAHDFALKFKAELVFYHVIDERIFFNPAINFMPPNYSPIPIIDQEVIAKFIQSSKDALDKILDTPDFKDIKISKICEEGIPYTTILNFAEKNAIDLILIGSHGSTGLKHLFLGSVADYISHHSNIPVLIVKINGVK